MQRLPSLLLYQSCPVVQVCIRGRQDCLLAMTMICSPINITSTLTLNLTLSLALALALTLAAHPDPDPNPDRNQANV